MMIQTAYKLLVALANNDTAVLDKALATDAYLQIQGNGRMQIYWTRSRVRAALLADFARWENLKLNIGDITPLRGSVTVTYRMEIVKDGRPITHERFAMLIFHKGQVKTMILYCYDEILNAPSGIWSLSFLSEYSPMGQMAVRQGMDLLAC
jgi:hypothetical protein